MEGSDRFSNGEMAWDVGVQESADDEITLGDATRWIEFIVGFLQEWADSDWIPTFDMLLVYQEPPIASEKFWGTCSVAI